MPSSPAEQIKEKLDVVEFLKGYLQLTPAGKNWKGLCPFHKEKTPSFMVSPERQSWHCFGCSLGGDIFAFLMRHENLEFGEALRVLAERAGIELRRLNPAEYKFVGLLYEINDAAKTFFRKQLEASPVAQEYLKQRKLAKETIEEFELGWAPNASDALTLNLLNSKYAPEDIVRAGLALKSERGSQFDRFRGRIMFPIHNHMGKVVGFTGRILPQFDTGEMGKYVNSPETPIFAKSKLLYGFSKTKNAIREANTALVVEGQMDVLMSYQSGVKNVVASSGTALTADHLRALRRVTDSLIMNFDNDEAGLAAGERAIDLAQQSDFNVKVLVLRDAKDLAEAGEKDPEHLRAAVEGAVPAPEFYFERYVPGGAIDRRSRDGLRKVRTVLLKLKAIASPIEESYWMKKLSERLGIPEGVLVEEAAAIEVKVPPVAGAEENLPDADMHKFSRWELLSQELVAAAVAKNDFGVVEDCAPQLAPIYREVLARFRAGDRTSSDPAIDDCMNLVVLRSGAFDEREVTDLKHHLTREYLSDRRRELAELVKRAEAAGDEEALRSALLEFKELPADTA